jgi:ribosomal protein S18 acetylase RimI-like enzyme
MARIREITERDVAQTAEILANSEPWVSRGTPPDELHRMLSSAVGRGDVFIAEEDSAPTGVASFIPEPVIAEGGCIRFIAVRPDKRRHGIGRQLMGFVERKVFGRSQNIFVSFGSGNEMARRFFERLGYQKVGEVPDPSGAGSGEWILRKPGTAKRDYRRPATVIGTGQPTGV